MNTILHTTSISSFFHNPYLLRSLLLLLAVLLLATATMYYHVHLVVRYKERLPTPLLEKKDTPRNLYYLAVTKRIPHYLTQLHLTRLMVSSIECTTLESELDTLAQSVRRRATYIGIATLCYLVTFGALYQYT